MNVSKYVILFVVGLVFGTTMANLDYDINPWTAFIITIVFCLIFFTSYFLYIMYFTKNVNQVEKFIQKRKKHAYYSLLIAMVNKRHDETEHYLNKLGRGYKQTKLAVQAWSQLERKQHREAEETIKKVKNNNARNCYFALLYLAQGNWELFEKYKNLVKLKHLQYMIAAELAFSLGESEEAEKHGEQAIASTGGLQRWQLVKSRQIQRNIEDRQFYF